MALVNKRMLLIKRNMIYKDKVFIIRSITGLLIDFYIQLYIYLQLLNKSEIKNRNRLMFMN